MSNGFQTKREMAFDKLKETDMTQDDIERMWKVASNDPNHDTNWHDPVVIAFARLLERRIWSMDNPHLRIALDAAQDKARRDEREACAKISDNCGSIWISQAIRARGEA